MSRYNMVELGTLIQQAKTVRCGDGDYPVLSMTMHDGLVFQDDKFKKIIASKDQSDYKVVKRNQLVISFPIDEGVLAAQRIVDAGIVSPAYGIWDINQEKILPEFLEYALRCDRALSYYKAKLRGSTARRRSLPTPTLLAFTVPLLDISEQKHILEVIHKTKSLISKRTEEIKLLDNLTKARFVELFGDPVANEKGLPTLPMTDLCEIIDGDRGKNYPKQEEFSEEGFCLFLNAKNVTSNGFSFENCMYITEEKDRILRNGKLSRGDVVLTTRGTLGNLAFYDDSVPHEHMRINSGMVILRMKRDRITERFFIEQFKMQLASIKERIASGSAQPQLPISTMNKIVMLVPGVELQNQFATFVEQTDKSKVVVQKALDEAQTLFDSLMQEYFG